MKKICFPIILSAPSGAGKTSLARSVIEIIKSMEFCSSHTSRSTRNSENKSRDYGFAAKRRFPYYSCAEWSWGHGNFYSTPTKAPLEIINKSFDVVFDTDVCGGLTLRRKFPTALLIFILPPSYDLLRFRLSQRSSETQKKIDSRLNFKKAIFTLLALLEYDYILINDDFNDTAKKLLLCIENHRRWLNMSNHL